MSDDRTTHLIDSHQSGGMTSAERDELNALLMRSEDARKEFLRAARVHVGLTLALNRDTVIAEDDAEAEGKVSPAGSGRMAVAAPLRGFRRLAQEFMSQPLSLVLLVSAMISAGLLIWQLSQSRPVEVVRDPHPALPAEATPKIVAQLSRTAGAKWRPAENGKLPIDGMNLLAGDRLALREGLAEIVFHTGATVILQGPAELEVGGRGSGVRSQESGVRGQGSGQRGDNSCSLIIGKLVARVPEQAHGFTVHTPTLKIVDLGTEFGVTVQTAKNLTPDSRLLTPVLTEVHVLRGEVIVYDDVVAKRARQNGPSTLKGGDGLICRADGQWASIKANASAFVSRVPVHTPSIAGVTWPRDSSLRPGDIVAMTSHDLKLVKIDPKTGAQALLATGKRDVHGDWTCVAIDRKGNVLVGARRLPGVAAGVLRINPRDGAITVLGRGGQFSPDGSAAFHGLAEAADGDVYATLQSKGDGQIVRIDPVTGDTSRVAALSDACGIHMDVNGRDFMVTGSDTGVIAQLRDGVVTPWLADRQHLGALLSVVVRPEGQVLVGCTKGEVRKIFKIGRDAPHEVTMVATLPVADRATDRQGGPWNIAAEADGNLIASPGGHDTRILRIDTTNGNVSVVSAGGLLGGETLVTVVPEILTQP
ncbi:MAG: hypothetical protein K8T91_08725 [Planctomycetes bacterium]|nr:hypothetical protein [Planctomycetota bacterium]